MLLFREVMLIVDYSGFIQFVHSVTRQIARRVYKRSARAVRLRLARADDAAQSRRQLLLISPRRDTDSERASRDSLLKRDWRRRLVGFVSVEFMPVRSIDSSRVFVNA